MDNFDLKKYLVENKVTRNSQMLNEAADSVDKALEDPKVKKAGEELASDPAKLKKALDQAKAMGVDINALKQAAKAVQAGKPIDNIVRDEVEVVKQKAEDEKAMEEGGAARTGAGIGAASGLFVGLTTAAGIVGAAAAAPVALVTALVLGIAGYAIGRGQEKKMQAYADEYGDDAATAAYGKDWDK